MRLLRWLVVTEINGWRSLFYLVTRRVRGRRPGDLTFGYAKEQGPVIGAFIFGSALELVVVHLLLPWETIRLIADILSLWGLLWMVGYLASVIVHPHLVGPDGVRVRYGATTDIPIAWSDVASVRVRRGGADGVAVMNRTNVEVALKQAENVRLFADDKKGFVVACEQFIAARAAG
jgi:hypothetical protein